MQVVIFGHGAVGRETAKLLAARGDKVRIAQRKQPAQLPAGAQFAPTDALDPDSVRRAVAGCRAAICCLGFPYDSRMWETAWPRAMANLLAACEAEKARFVFADNLYMYGPQDRPLVEDMALTSYRPQAAPARRNHPPVARRPQGGTGRGDSRARLRFLRAGRREFGAVAFRGQKAGRGQGGADSLFPRPSP